MFLYINIYKIFYIKIYININNYFFFFNLLIIYNLYYSKKKLNIIKIKQNGNRANS
jgi:hypothetical protein